jgi:hypothetical protein
MDRSWGLQDQPQMPHTLRPNYAQEDTETSRLTPIIMSVGWRIVLIIPGEKPPNFTGRMTKWHAWDWPSAHLQRYCTPILPSIAWISLREFDRQAKVNIFTAQWEVGTQKAVMQPCRPLRGIWSWIEYGRRLIVTVRFWTTLNWSVGFSSW